MTQGAAAQISNTYSEYITKLQGVINANVVFIDGEIEEIHVLSDTFRTPKQIVRDIQSLFQAQFQKDIDHRIISVAQIESELNPTTKHYPRFLIEAITVAKKRDQTDVEVTLSLDGKMFIGKQVTLKDNYDVYRGIAQATVNSIAIANDSRQKYTILDVRFSEIAGERMAISCVSLSSPSNIICRCTGTAFSSDDDSVAIVKATLSAVNRRIGYC